MKISCQSCQAKYTIADDKVAGKTVKIKCKKCGATIVVHGEDGAAGAPGLEAAPAAASHEDDGEGEGDTRVFGNEGGPAPGSDEWTVTITDDDQRSLTPAQILIEFQRGLITVDSYVWKDGMADWLPLSGVPELMAIVGAGARPAAGARAPAAAQAPAAAAAAPRPAAIAAPPPNAENVGLGGTMMMDQPSPLAATPAPGVAAARRAVNRPAVDLFATSERPRVDPGGGSGSGPSFSSATTSADRLVGERNENSVLFSLSALTATENAGRSNKSKNDDAVLDMRPSGGSPPRNNARAGMDDIMNLGGGMAQAPILAPPPLLAPVIEAPAPAPQQVAPVMGAPASPMMIVPEMTPQKKSPTGLILGIVAGLAVVGGLAAFFLMRTPAPGPGATDQATNTTATAAITAAPTPTETAAVPPPVETAQVAAATPSGTPTAATAVVKSGTPTGAVTTGGKAPDKTPEPAKTAEPVKTAEPAKTADPAPAAGGKEFDRAAALSALNKAAGAAKGCKKDDGPTGSGKVRVTFAPSGNVTSATVEGPPFAGTPVGGCVASAFRGAHVPPFDGSPVAVPKSFSIN
jgi:predicted Zn finger-like uncharacterized protein